MFGIIKGIFGGLTGGIGPLAIYLVVFASGGLIGSYSTHKVDAAHYGMQIQEGKVQLANEKASHLADLKAISDKARQAADDALLTQQNMQHHLAALDAQHTKEKNDAENTIAQLRRNVDAGNVRLRIAVAKTHPTCSNGLPEASGSPSVDDGTVDLAPEARQAYFDLRSSIVDDQQKIEALQDYAKNVCAPPK